MLVAMSDVYRTRSGNQNVESNVDAALRFYEAFVSDDPAVLDRTLAPGWTVHPPAPGGPQGVDGYRPVLQGFRAAFPDCTVAIDDAFGAGDRVVVRCTMRATHRAPFLGVAGTGTPIELRTCDIHRIAGDRIAQSWHIEDLLGFLVQVGAVAAG